MTAQLKKMCKGRGLGDDNPYDLLGPDLRHEFGVAEHDIPEDVRTKAARRLNELIDRLSSDESRTIARYSFNVTDDPELREMTLVQRQDRLKEKGGPARKTSYNRMYRKIIPDVVRMMMADRRR